MSTFLWEAALHLKRTAGKVKRPSEHYQASKYMPAEKLSEEMPEGEREISWLKFPP
jgi:hypothetical protein